MGSLEEPYDPLKAPQFVVWPAPGMKDVPLAFHGLEFPNPLDDQPEAERDLRVVGYPISLQLQREFASSIGDADIQLFEALKGGKPPQRHLLSADGTGIPGTPKTDKTDAALLKDWHDRRHGSAIPLYKHTPRVPLLKRMEEREVIFGIPKAHLEFNKGYQVEVSMETKVGKLLFIWEFATGTQTDGLKF